MLPIMISRCAEYLNTFQSQINIVIVLVHVCDVTVINYVFERHLIHQEKKLESRSGSVVTLRLWPKISYTELPYFS